MKRKILYICLVVFMYIDSVLINYILEREPVCDQVHWSDVDRTKDIVPDEETAIRIAEANFKMEKSGWGYHYHDEIVYQIEVTYDEPSYEWIVTYQEVTLEGELVLDGSRIFGVRRDNGFVFWYGWNRDDMIMMGYHDSF